MFSNFGIELGFKVIKWFKNRFEIFFLTLRHSPFLVIFGVLQIIELILLKFPPSIVNSKLLQVSAWVPWYAWVIGWLLLLWLGAVEYSFRKKERFDFTSASFFKAYLEFLINEGGKLAGYSEDKDFYSKVSDWQRQVVGGIAIGLGPMESERYFQKMDGKNPLTEAYRESLTLKNNDPLCRALLENVEELKAIRQNLTGAESYESDRIGSGKKKNGAEMAAIPRVELIDDSNPARREEKKF
jgi:hypothetical protein